MTGAALCHFLSVRSSACEISLTHGNMGPKPVILVPMALTKAPSCGWRHQQTWTRAIWVRKPCWHQWSLYFPASTWISPSFSRWGLGSESLFPLRKKQVVWFTIWGCGAAKDPCPSCSGGGAPTRQEAITNGQPYCTHLMCICKQGADTDYKHLNVFLYLQTYLFHTSMSQHGLTRAWGAAEV